MVSLFATLLVSAAVVASSSHALEVGEFFRPTGDHVSGRVGATTPYVRSPCPALNTLANHGYLPRDGKDITHAELGQALRSVYNLGDNFVDRLVERMPERLALSDLSKHGYIEHDASLVHADFSDSEIDPSTVVVSLWENVLSHAKDGRLGASQLAAIRRDRAKVCYAKPEGCDLSVKQRVLTFGEAALLLRALGGKNVELISVEFAKSFLVDERIPATYEKPATPVTILGTAVTAGNVQLLAFFQGVAAWVFP